MKDSSRITFTFQSKDMLGGLICHLLEKLDTFQIMACTTHARQEKQALYLTAVQNLREDKINQELLYGEDLTN